MKIDKASTTFKTTKKTFNKLVHLKQFKIKHYTRIACDEVTGINEIAFQ